MLRLGAGLEAQGRGHTEHGAWGQGGEQMSCSGPAQTGQGGWPHQVKGELGGGVEHKFLIFVLSDRPCLLPGSKHCIFK